MIKILVNSTIFYLIIKFKRLKRLISLKLNLFFFQNNSKYKKSQLAYYYESSSKIFCYCKSSKTISYSPLVENNQQKETIFNPDLYFRSIKNIYSTAYSYSFLLGDGTVIIPNHVAVEKEKPTSFESFPLILSYGKSSIYSIRDPSKYFKYQYDKVFVIGGTINWYHFIFETLPKLYLIEKYYGIQAQKILVMEELLKYPNFKSALKLFSGSNTLLTASKEEIIFIKEAIIIDDFNCAIKEAKLRHKLRPSDWSINPSIIKEFASIFRSRLTKKNDQKDKKLSRIFLARKSTSARFFNQEELLEIAFKYGFNTIYLENYSLDDQYKIIANAKYLAGPPGAAWASLIFAKFPLKCLSWIPQGKYKYSSLYSTISKILGHHMMFFYSGTNLQIGSANFNQYYVSPEEFEKNLIKLLNS